MTTAPPNVQPPADHDGHDHDRGLAFDLSTLLNRRRMLQLIGGAGVLALAGCASSATGASGTTAAASALGRIERIERRLGDDGLGHHRGRREHDRLVGRLRRGRSPRRRPARSRRTARTA